MGPERADPDHGPPAPACRVEHHAGTGDGHPPQRVLADVRERHCGLPRTRDLQETALDVGQQPHLTARHGDLDRRLPGEG
ncbi:hypothetical protein ACFSSF_15345 [Dietzia aerolata]|uniref:hypothetical protein n=1 Tax=Dietzia aerolata TaxID=595984 RepID=UPI00363360B2